MQPSPQAPRPSRTPSISTETLYGLARQVPPAMPQKVRQLRGVVHSGVERNSRLLVGPDGTVLAQLMGGPPTVLAQGRAVIVTGVFVPDLLTTAQQGAPFQVRTAEPDLSGS